MDIRSQILALKNEKNAVILAHNYTRPEIQDIADMVGDSLGLSVEASKTDASIIVFCGVRFMGETAKILSPDKIVLLPESSAGCAMADMCNRKKLIEMKNKHSKAVVVGYVNTTAETKCEADVCCTSGNAVSVVESLDSNEILFIPDKNLGKYVASKCPGKNIILWDGCCPIHDGITEKEVLSLKSEHPSAKIIAHPECREDVLSLCDFVGSTEAMLTYCSKSLSKEFIVITEVGMKHRLETTLPEKEFFFPESALCDPMKSITLEKLFSCLKNMTGEVLLPEEVMKLAYAPVERMIGIK